MAEKNRFSKKRPEARKRRLHRMWLLEIGRNGPRYRAVVAELERKKREREPEYVRVCENLNRLLLEMQEECGVAFPLIDLDKDDAPITINAN